MVEPNSTTPTKKCILVADDEPDIIEMLQTMLEDAGYAVESTQRGDEVEKLAEKLQPDLIILDILMLGKDGRELAKGLKHSRQTRHIPILMISAHPYAEKGVHEVGDADFLAKPFDMEDLLRKVASYV